MTPRERAIVALVGAALVALSLPWWATLVLGIACIIFAIRKPPEHERNLSSLRK